MKSCIIFIIVLYWLVFIFFNFVFNEFEQCFNMCAYRSSNLKSSFSKVGLTPLFKCQGHHLGPPHRSHLPHLVDKISFPHQQILQGHTLVFLYCKYMGE